MTSATAETPIDLDSRVRAIAELEENRTVEGVYAVARKERLPHPHTARTYLALELVDPSGRITARVWNDVELLDARFGEGDAVRVLGRVERFRDRLQLDVRTLEAARASTRPRSRRRCAATRTSWRASSSSSSPEITHPGLHAAVERVLDHGDQRAAMRALPATLEGHHSYAGGLLEHTVGVATLCRETAQLHQRLRARPAARCCPRARRWAHARARGAGPLSRPTDEGRLLGHVHLGLRVIEERAPTPSTRACVRSCCTLSPCHHDVRSAAHRRGGGALPREPAGRRRGDETRQPF